MTKCFIEIPIFFNIEMDLKMAGWIQTEIKVTSAHVRVDLRFSTQKTT